MSIDAGMSANSLSKEAPQPVKITAHATDRRTSHAFPGARSCSLIRLPPECVAAHRRKWNPNTRYALWARQHQVFRLPNHLDAGFVRACREDACGHSRVSLARRNGSNWDAIVRSTPHTTPRSIDVPHGHG